MHANATFSIPFRVCILSRDTRVGIAATGYRHLCDILRRKYDISGHFDVTQEDGTIVCDEEYLKLLEPNTLLFVVESERNNSTGGSAATNLPSNAGVTIVRKRPAQTEVGPPLKQCNVYPDSPRNSYLLQSRNYMEQSPLTMHSSSQGQHQPTHFHLPSPFPTAPTPPQMRSPPQPTTCHLHPSPRPAYTHSPIHGIMPLTLPGANVNPPPPSRAPSVSATAAATSPLNLVSQLQITSVAGNVNMSPPMVAESTQRVLRQSPQTQPVVNPVPQPMVNPFPTAPPHIPQLGPVYCTPSGGYVCTATPKRVIASPYPQYVPVINRPVIFQPAQPVQQYRYVPSACPPLAPPMTPHPIRHVANTAYPPTMSHPSLPRSLQLDHHRQEYPHLPLTYDVLQSCQNDLDVLQRTVAQMQRRKKQPDVMQVTPTRKQTVTLTAAAANTSTRHSLPQRNVPRPPCSQSIPLECVSNSPSPDPQSCSTTVTNPSDNSENTSCSFPVLLVANDPQTPAPVLSPQAPKNDTETQKLATIKVVSCSSQSSLLPSGDGDEDDDQLCIIEQAPPLTPEPQAPSQEQIIKTRPKPHELHLVPFVQSPQPQSLGNAKYPIILDTETGSSNSQVVDTPLSDEGYSSSSSPYDTALDFTSQLPFANYEKSDATTTTKPADKVEEVGYVTPAPTDSCEKEKEREAECDGDTNEEYEEDFVMDIDVFSPGPTTTTVNPQPLPLPEYLPLETFSPQEKSIEGAGVGQHAQCLLSRRQRPQKLVVSIHRDSLSGSQSIPTPTPTPTLTSPTLSSCSLPSPEAPTSPTLSSSPPSLRSPRAPTHTPNSHTLSSFSPAASLRSPGAATHTPTSHTLSSSSPASSLRSPGAATHTPTSHTLSSSSPASSLRSPGAPTHTRRSPRLSSSSPRLSLLLMDALSRTYKRRRKHLRRHSSPGCMLYCSRKQSRIAHTAQRPLIVRVPIRTVDDGYVVRGASIEDSNEESDEPAATMELIASQLHGTKRNRRLASDIVHSNSETCDEKNRLQAEPIVQVEEYCSEVNVKSVCSEKNISECVGVLGDLCNASNCEAVMTLLDVGHEVEVDEQASDCTEMTGMELLNMMPVPTQFNKRPCSPLTTHSVSQDLALENEQNWKVHSLTRGTDPRHKVQWYSLGREALFELAFTGCTWGLTAL